MPPTEVEDLASIAADIRKMHRSKLRLYLVSDGDYSKPFFQELVRNLANGAAWHRWKGRRIEYDGGLYGWLFCGNEHDEAHLSIDFDPLAEQAMDKLRKIGVANPSTAAHPFHEQELIRFAMQGADAYCHRQIWLAFDEPRGRSPLCPCGPFEDEIEAIRHGRRAVFRCTVLSPFEGKSFFGAISDRIFKAIAHAESSTQSSKATGDSHGNGIGLRPTRETAVSNSLDELAVAAKVAHPKWSDQQIADYIGCRRETLFKPNMVKYKLAKKALKSLRDDLPSGEKYDGRIEAEDM